VPTFAEYAEQWLRDYARLECKPSTVGGYEGAIRLYLRPRFSAVRMDELDRNAVKKLIADMVGRNLARGTVRNAVSVLRGIFNQAIEDGLVHGNPATRLGRFTRAARTTGVKGIALTPAEVEQFLGTAKRVQPEHHALFLVAVRAGLRRGELVALQWGDIEFGTGDSDPNRFILVQHNYVHRLPTSTKTRKTRRVDMSRELRRTLLELRR